MDKKWQALLLYIEHLAYMNWGLLEIVTQKAKAKFQSIYRILQFSYSVLPVLVATDVKSLQIAVIGALYLVLVVIIGVVFGQGRIYWCVVLSMIQLGYYLMCCIVCKV